MNKNFIVVEDIDTMARNLNRKKKEEKDSDPIKPDASDSLIEEYKDINRECYYS